MEVYIDQGDWNKIMNYANAAYDTEKCEIGGMSVVTQDTDGDWMIQNPVILKQEIGSTTCDLDKEELAKYYTEMAVKYKNIDFRFCWWHSHHTMSAFWSGTDLSSIEEYGEGESDLSFALVVNLKEEYKCRISVWKPIEIHKDIKLNIIKDIDDKIPVEILAEVKAKCETRSYKTTYVNNHTNLSLWKQPNGSYKVPNYLDKKDEIPALTSKEENQFEKDYQYLNDKINIWMENYEKKTWNWKRVKSAIKSTNILLETKNSSLRIDELKKSDIDEYQEMICMPYEIMTVVNFKYQESFDNMVEFMSYNASYGGYM